MKPRFGRKRIGDITIDHVARLVTELHTEGKAGWTIRNVLTTLSALMAWASRRGLVAANPVVGLEKSERPKVGRREQRILEREEIGRLLAGASSERYRVLLATAVFSGLRLMELLALRWQDVDFAGGYLRVRKQLKRSGGLADLKTHSGSRDVVLMPELAALLRKHRIASPYSGNEDYLFAAETGGPLSYRNVERRALDAAVEKAKLNQGRPAPTAHDLRHTYASRLIGAGQDVVFVSRQLGHADPAITLRVYAHLFDRVSHADRVRAALSAGFGKTLESGADESGPTGAKATVAEIRDLQAVSTVGD